MGVERRGVGREGGVGYDRGFLLGKRGYELDGEGEEVWRECTSGEHDPRLRSGRPGKGGSSWCSVRTRYD